MNQDVSQKAVLGVVCALCGHATADHRGRLTAVVGSPWGARSESLTLCEAHMLVALDALSRHAWAYGMEEPRGLFDLAAWARPQDLGRCELCGRSYLHLTSGSSKVAVKGWEPVRVCEPCSCDPFGQLCERAQRTFGSAQKKEIELTREGLIEYLRSKGKSPWVAEPTRDRER